MTSVDRTGFAYDDENQLIFRESMSADWQSGSRSEFVYDGKNRLRRVLEYSWSPVAGTTNGTWSLWNDTRYIYDGMVVVQERTSSNVPSVSYTRGNDLSGTLQGAGGIGGLLARSSTYNSSTGNWSNHYFYHADGNGNVTYLISPAGALGAAYKYDPFGKKLSSSGSMATANLYQFSSKMFHIVSGMAYYGYRWYDPNLQRWLNRDPLAEVGGINLFTFVGNSPINLYDLFGFSPVPPPGVPTPPANIPGGPWKWNPDPNNSRGGTFGPVRPIPGGPQPSLTWDPINHYWKTTPNPQRYDPSGKPIGVNDGKKGHCPRPNPPAQTGRGPQSPPPNYWWPQIIRGIIRFPVIIILDPNVGKRPPVQA